MKHAYLIMAHNNFETLKKIIQCYDDEKNDIFIHINKSSKEWSPSLIEGSVEKAKLHFVNRVKVGYLNYSQLDAIKSLFNEASKEFHDYYHLLSGSDLPLKTQKEINDFFEKNKGKEFVGFESWYDKTRVHQKNYFLKYSRDPNKYVAYVAKKTRKYLINIQKFLGYDVMRNYGLEIKKGYDWFSITHNAVKYLLKKEPEFRKYFYRSFCPTEHFVQTLLYNSHFRNNIYSLTDENKGSQRFIDWNRGKPYVFKKEDENLLLKSPYMFGRKFSSDIDSEIINVICNYVKNK